MFMIPFGMLNSFAIDANSEKIAKDERKKTFADPTISVITSSTISCNNDVSLSVELLSGSNPTDRINFYFDSNLTQQIIDVSVGEVSYSITNSGSVYFLNISNLNITQTYYAARVNELGQLQTAVGDAPFIEVSPKNVYKNTIQPILQGCGSVNLSSAIQIDQALVNTSDIIRFYDSNSNQLTSSVVNQSGVYKVSILSNGCLTESNVTVTINEAANLNVSNPQILLSKGQTTVINANSSNGATITYYDILNNRIQGSTVGPFNTAGNYIIRVDAQKGGCTTSEFVYITVDDDSVCKIITNRVYANKATKFALGIVSNLNLAADSNPNTYATMSLPIGLLGLIQNYVDLEFAQPIPKGKAITIKLGNEYGGLDLLSGGTLTTLIKNNNGNIRTSGTPQSINANLLGLLNGINEYEVSFVPNPANASNEVYGVRILMTSALSVAQNLKVFDAYYYSDTPKTTCDNDVIDVLSGTKGYGVNVLNNTVGVDNPRNFYDNNDATYSRMYVGVGVLAESYLTPIYSSYSYKDDIIEMIIKKPNDVLDLTLLGALTYRKFDGNVAVSELNSVDTNFLSLTLLSGSTDKYVLRMKDDNTSGPWDRFELRLGAVANVLNFIDIYSIKRVPSVSFEGIPEQVNYTFCVGQQLSIEPKDCTTYVWYSHPTDTNSVLSETNIYTIPNNVSGNQTVYVQAIRNGCEVLDRLAINYTVGSALTAQNIATTSGFNPPSDCAGNVTLTATVTPPNPNTTLTNVYYQWYKLVGNTHVLVPGENSNTLSLTDLEAGAYTYYVGVGSDEFCLTPQADRKRINFIVPRLNRADDFSTSSIVNECNTLAVTITANTSLTNVQYKWYFDEEGINEITNATIGGVTYQIIGNKLLVSGLQSTQTNISYYATLSSDQTCLNTKDLQRVDVIYNPSVALDVLVAGDQFFCKTQNTTLADIRLNYTDVNWYSTPQGGTALPLTTVLVDNTTYYAIRTTQESCDDITRLAVKVLLDDIPAPIVPTNQTFCSTENATILSLNVANYDIIWKDALGNVLPDTQILQNGGQYYAYAKVGQNCESLTGTMVTVTITTPTVSSVSDTLVVCDNTLNLSYLIAYNNADWYYDVAKLNVIPANAVLQPGATYYSTLVDNLTCLTVNYAITIQAVPSVFTLVNTTPVNDYCLNQQYTFTATPGYNSYNWYVSDATIISGGTLTDSSITVIWNSEGQQTISVEVDNLNCLQTNKAEIKSYVIKCSYLTDPDLSIEIVADKTQPYYLDEVTFNVNIHNLTDHNFKNVVIQVPLNSGFEFKNISVTDGSFERDEWIIPEIKANETHMCIVKAKVLEFGSYEHRVEILSSLPKDINASNNVASVVLNPITNECLVAYNEISPNQDGINDYFEISCIQNYPQTKLEIYNRYGSLVYKNNNYDNTFNGYANVSGTFGGKELPSGTYFYTLQFSDGVTAKKSGWLYIMR